MSAVKPRLPPFKIGSHKVSAVLFDDGSDDPYRRLVMKKAFSHMPKYMSPVDALEWADGYGVTVVLTRLLKSGRKASLDVEMVVIHPFEIRQGQ